jgi:hypothetical protein
MSMISFRSARLSYPISLTGTNPRANIVEVRVKEGHCPVLTPVNFRDFAWPGAQGQHHDSANEPA